VLMIVTHDVRLAREPVLVIGAGTISLTRHAAAIDGVEGPVPLVPRPRHPPGGVVEIIIRLQATGIIVPLVAVGRHAGCLEEITVLADQAAASRQHRQANSQAKKKDAHPIW